MNKSLISRLVILFVLSLSLIQIFGFALVSPGGGDDGVYAAFAYHGMHGDKAFLDYWSQQGFAYSSIIGFFAKFFGVTLLAQRMIFAMFSLLTILYVVLFTKFFLKSKGIEEKTGHWLILGLIAAASLGFWHWMAQLGTKSSFVEFLLIASIYHLCRFLKDFQRSHLLFAAFLAGSLISSKYNFMYVPVLGSLLVVIYAPRRWLNLSYFVGFGAITVLFYHWPLLNADGINAFLLNFEITRLEYLIPTRLMSEAQKLDIVNAMLEYTFYKYCILIPMFLYMAQKRILFSVFKDKANLSAKILIYFGIANIVANTIALYPRLFTLHQDPSYPVLVLGMILLCFDVWDKKGPFFFKSLFTQSFALALAIVLLTLVNHKLLTTISPIGYGRFAFHLDFKHIKVELMGKNAIVTELDKLFEHEGFKEYVYMGRSNYMALKSKMKEAPISASGTALIETQKPPRDVANKVKSVSISNLDDLLQKYNVFVIEDAQFAFAGAYQTLIDKIIEYKLVKVASETDGKYTVFVKPKI